MRGLLLAAILWLGFNIGWQLHDALTINPRRAEVRPASRVQARQSEISSRVAESFRHSSDQTRTVYRTLYREVPAYVSASTTDQRTVPLGLVRLLNAAATGVSAVSAPSDEPNDAPAAAGLDVLASSVVANYETCNTVRTQLLNLQDWIRNQAEP
jgi:hypothetical protein